MAVRASAGRYARDDLPQQNAKSPDVGLLREEDWRGLQRLWRHPAHGQAQRVGQPVLLRHGINQMRLAMSALPPDTANRRSQSRQSIADYFPAAARCGPPDPCARTPALCERVCCSGPHTRLAMKAMPVAICRAKFTCSACVYTSFFVRLACPDSPRMPSKKWKP